MMVVLKVAGWGRGALAAQAVDGEASGLAAVVEALVVVAEAAAALVAEGKGVGEVVSREGLQVGGKAGGGA